MQYELGALADFYRRKSLSVCVLHREGERGFGDVIYLEAQIGAVARGGFAALLGTDARHHETANTALDELPGERRAREGRVRMFFNAERRLERGEPVYGANLATRF
jgi:hypothetical protein